MLIIGLTGGIASGKSTVSGMLDGLGAYVIDADKVARLVVEPGKPAWREIVDWLGEGALLDGDQLDRKKIGELVFSDNAARKKLEEITHPIIREEMLNDIAFAASQGFSIIVLDVPLLFETGWKDFADEIWVVYVDRKNQLERLMKRDKITREQAEARISAQMDLAEKAKLADIVIDNSKDIESTRQQVERAWRKVLAKVLAAD